MTNPMANSMYNPMNDSIVDHMIIDQAMTDPMVGYMTDPVTPRLTS